MQLSRRTSRPRGRSSVPTLRELPDEQPATTFNLLASESSGLQRVACHAVALEGAWSDVA